MEIKMMMDHLSHLESLFGDESSQGDELRRPSKGWSQLILEKQAEFESSLLLHGGENGKDLLDGQQQDKISNNKPGTNGNHHCDSHAKKLNFYGSGHSDDDAKADSFKWCQSERNDNNNQAEGEFAPSDFDYEPLSPCFVRGDDGLVTTFTSADLPLTSHRFLNPRTTPPYIPSSQGTIENVASPVAGANNQNSTWGVNSSSHRHHHHHHNRKTNKHHHKHSSGKKKSSKHSQQQGGVVAANNSSSSNSGGSSVGGVAAVGGKNPPSPFKLRRLTSILDSPEKHGTKMRRLSPYNYNLGSHQVIHDSGKKRSHRSRHRSNSSSFSSSGGTSILEQRLLQKLPEKRKVPEESYTPPALALGPSAVAVFRTPEKPKRKRRSKAVSSPELSLIEEVSPRKETIVPAGGAIEELNSPQKSPLLSPVVIRRSCSQAVVQILLSPASLAAKLQFNSSFTDSSEPMPLSGILEASPSPPPPPQPQPVAVDKECSDGSSQLSCRISEEQSTQEESSVVSLTPIGRWMHEDTERQPLMTVIEEEESEFPREDSNVPAHLQSDSEMWTVVEGRKRRRFNLCEEMATILRRYESSVRMFPHDLRTGKFQVDNDSSPPMTLIVRAVGSTDSKSGIWTICTDFASGDHKAVLFRGHSVQEFKIGCLIELFPPWKTLKMEGVPCEVIICADFHKILLRAGERLEGPERSILDAILGIPVPKSLTESLSTVPYTDAIHNSFINLLPDGARNRRSVAQQFMENSGRTEIGLDEVELLKWTRDGKQVIIQDKNGSACLVEVQNNDFEVSECLSGSIVTFEKLEVLKKMTETENPVLFSVLRVLQKNGGVATSSIAYLVKLDNPNRTNNVEDATTTSSVQIHKAIHTPLSREVLCDRKFIHEIRQMMEHLEESCVQRVCVLCLVTEVKDEGLLSSKISIEDRLGYSMEIHCVGGDCGRLGLSDGSFVALDFLRVSGGELPTFDEFSSILPPSSYEIM